MPKLNIQEVTALMTNLSRHSIDIAPKLNIQEWFSPLSVKVEYKVVLGKPSTLCLSSTSKR